MAESSNPFEWHPAKFLRTQDPSPEFALLILNQPLKNGSNLRRLWRNSTLRIAADGGANRLHDLSSFQAKFSSLHGIIGDLDSLKPQVRDFYTSQPTPAKIIHDPDQETTDFGKAVTYIRSTQPPGSDIIALGGIGGRVDQGVSQLHHLYLFHPSPDYAEGRVYLLSGSSLTFFLKAGKHKITVNEEGEEKVFGKHVGLVPLRGKSILTTRGLEWDVEKWESEIGGRVSTSNAVKEGERVVEVETSADILFTIALGQQDESDES